MAKEYEHMCETLYAQPNRGESVVSVANKLGKDGWELVTVVHHDYSSNEMPNRNTCLYFKREVASGEGCG